MSFERTSTSIKNLSNQEEITLDLLFDMMVCVSQDVMNYNNTTDLSDTPIGDQSVLLKKVYNLMQLTLSAYTKNKEGMSEFGASIQERYAKLVDDMNSVLSEVAEVKEHIEKAEAKKRELQTKQAELQESRGHLLTVGEDCEALQRQIDVLSDSALDEKAKEKEKLEVDLSERKTRADVLEKEKSELRTKIDEVHEKIETIKNTILTLQAEETALGDEENSLLLEKNGLEKGIENLKQKLKEYKEWIDNYPAMSEQVRTEHDEEKAKITTMINALNSALSESFLKENLFKTSGATDNCSVENYPDYVVAEAHFENIQELQQWFNDMSERINGLINVYETMLRNFVNQSDKLTSESDS